MEEIYKVIEEFKQITNSKQENLYIEKLEAPHNAVNLLKEMQAIYIFERDSIFLK